MGVCIFEKELQRAPFKKKKRARAQAWFRFSLEADLSAGFFFLKNLVFAFPVLFFDTNSSLLASVLKGGALRGQ